jgi:plastocyanin
MKLPLSLILVAFMVVACQTDSEAGTEVSFQSGNIAPGNTFSYTFEERGTVEYYCRIHAPNMQGTVTVASDAAISGQDTVEMMNNQFIPGQITVAPNTEIVWLNNGNEVHTVVDGNPSTGGNGGY